MLLPCFLTSFYYLERHDLLLCFLTFWLSFGIIFFISVFLPLVWRACVFRAKLLWPSLLTQTVYPYSNWKIIERIVWVARGRWVSQWTEMSTRTYASLNRIETIKTVSHHYCHCRQNKSFVLFAQALQVSLIWKKERRFLLKCRPKEGAWGCGAFIDPLLPQNIGCTDYACLPISNSAW